MNNKGYGTTFFNGKRYYAHRLSYLLNVGEIPEGMFVCHKCDTPSCIEPTHLFLGTPKDNTSDSVTKLRHAHGAKVITAKLSEEDAVRVASDPRSFSDIARAFNVSPGAVWAIKRRKKWKHLKVPIVINKGKFRPIGERHHMAKLTEDQVRRIIADERTSLTISRDYGVGRRAIDRIKTGERWPHVLTSILPKRILAKVEQVAAEAVQRRKADPHPSESPPPDLPGESSARPDQV